MNYPEKYRVAGDPVHGDGGMFIIPFMGREFQIVASHGGGWNHVSVALKNRCPNWREMCYIKDIFFNDDDWVIQYHPPKLRNINFHEFCLHLWQPQNEKIPVPPLEFV